MEPAVKPPAQGPQTRTIRPHPYSESASITGNTIVSRRPRGGEVSPPQIRGRRYPASDYFYSFVRQSLIYKSCQYSGQYSKTRKIEKHSPSPAPHLYNLIYPLRRFTDFARAGFCLLRYLRFLPKPLIARKNNLPYPFLSLFFLTLRQ